MTTTISDDLKLNNGSGKVELFDFDLTMFGGPIYHFTPQPCGDLGYVTFGGVQYQQFPFQLSGVSNSAEGSLPRPTLAVGAVSNLVFKAALIQYGSLLGAKVTRRITYAKYLDGASNANSSYHSVAESWFINQVQEHSKTQIVFELALPMDRPNIILPPGQILKVASGNPYDVYAPGMNRI